MFAFWSDSWSPPCLPQLPGKCVQWFYWAQNETDWLVVPGILLFTLLKNVKSIARTQLPKTCRFISGSEKSDQDKTVLCKCTATMGSLFRRQKAFFFFCTLQYHKKLLWKSKWVTAFVIKTVAKIRQILFFSSSCYINFSPWPVNTSNWSNKKSYLRAINSSYIYLRYEVRIIPLTHLCWKTPSFTATCVALSIVPLISLTGRENSTASFWSPVTLTFLTFWWKTSNYFLCNKQLPTPGYLNPS